eukprot:scaffold159469_cov52-Attheya_sp.AAC.1
MKTRKYLIVVVFLLSKGSQAWIPILKTLSSSLRKQIHLQGTCKPVDKLDPSNNGQVLETFPSLTAAAISVGESVSCMSSVVRGKRSSSRLHGFAWRFKYVHDEGGVEAISTAVEKLSLTSGEVLESFPSITKAARMTDGATRKSIRNVLQGKNKSAAGFFWREEGSNALPSSEARGLNKKPVEKVCLESGAVLGTFGSVVEAANSVGMVPSAVSQVLTGNVRTAGGFFWRYKGSPTKIRQTRKNSRSYKVEKLCVESGEMLETFDSLTDASNAMRASPSSICDVFSGRSMSCRGFFWRRKGSTVMPLPEAVRFVRRSNATVLAPNMKQHPLEKLSLESGEVLEEFELISDAAASIGQSSQSINNVLNGRANSCKGFFWRYRGSTQLPIVEPITSPNRVEKCCLAASSVIETYSSIADAARRSGASIPGIRKVIEGNQSTCNGYFWRFEGSKQLPATPTPYFGSKPVEKICLESSKVLETFDSITQASHSFNPPSLPAWIYKNSSDKTTRCAFS